jgi:hypothetical protein
MRENPKANPGRQLCRENKLERQPCRENKPGRQPCKKKKKNVRETTLQKKKKKEAWEVGFNPRVLQVSRF